MCWFATLLLQLPDGGSKNIRVGLAGLNFPWIWAPPASPAGS